MHHLARLQSYGLGLECPTGTHVKCMVPSCAVHLDVEGLVGAYVGSGYRGGLKVTLQPMPLPASPLLELRSEQLASLCTPNIMYYLSPGQKYQGQLTTD